MTHPSQPGSGSLRPALALIGVVLLMRAVYLSFLCPYELAADEAQYWDWSRRLGLSYATKGPGIAWLIRGSTELFGHAEWAVRLPAAISTALSMLAVAGLASSLGTPERARSAAFLAAAAFLFIPAYHATAILMTIDAPYLACWALSCWCAWELVERERRGRPTALLWIALGAALGLGFLFKYTILLLLPGLALWGLSLRAVLPRDRGRIGRAALALIAFIVLASPVIVWNHLHGWPTLAHLLGHLGAPGGDAPARPAAFSFDPRTFLEFLGTQAGMIGPALGLMVIAARTLGRTNDPRRPAVFVLACSLPILVFYAVVSFFSDAEGNWPIAGYLTLVSLAGAAAASELPRYRELLTNWKQSPDRPRAGIFRRAPETPFQIAWHWSLVYGLIAALAVVGLNLLERVPLLSGVIPYHRVSGHAEFASRVHEVVERSASAGGLPFVVADQYTRAALLAYYLPGQRAVRSATSFMGGRRSSYDDFADTSLVDPAIMGRDAVLVGADADRWNAAFYFDRIEQRLSKPPERQPVYVGENYRGPRTTLTPGTASPEPRQQEAVNTSNPAAAESRP